MDREEQGKFIQAKVHVRRTLLLKEKALGPEHHLVARCLRTLAFIYEAKLNYRKAEPLYQRALAINEKTLGEESDTVADNPINLWERHRYIVSSHQFDSRTDSNTDD